MIILSKYPEYSAGYWWVEVVEVLGSGCRILKSKRFSNPFLAQAYCNVLRADPDKYARKNRSGYRVEEI